MQSDNNLCAVLSLRAETHEATETLLTARAASLARAITPAQRRAAIAILRASADPADHLRAQFQAAQYQATAATSAQHRHRA